MTTWAANMDNLSAGEAGGIFAGLIALLASIGAGVRWMIGWRDSRQDLREAKLNQWEESLARREKEQREAIEERLKVVEDKLSIVSMALFETVAELQVLDPANPSLAKARIVLSEAYPVDFEAPEWMKTLLGRIDRKEETR